MSSSYEYEFKWFSYVRFYQTYLPQIGLVSDYFSSFEEREHIAIYDRQESCFRTILFNFSN